MKKNQKKSKKKKQKKKYDLYTLYKTQEWVGRHVEVLSLMNLLVKTENKVTIMEGKTGMGKSTIAKAAITYMCERRIFDGFAMIDIRKCRKALLDAKKRMNAYINHHSTIKSPKNQNHRFNNNNNNNDPFNEKYEQRKNILSSMTGSDECMAGQIAKAMGITQYTNIENTQQLLEWFKARKYKTEMQSYQSVFGDMKPEDSCFHEFSL